MAEMRLTEPDSSGDAGIDVVASPPGKEAAERATAERRREGDDGLALLIAIFRVSAEPVLYFDESGCAAGRSERGTVHAIDRRDERTDTVHRGDAQRKTNGDGQRALRRDDAGAGRIEDR